MASSYSSYSSQSSLTSSLTNSLGRSEYGFTQVEIYRDAQIGTGAFGMVCKARADHLECAAKFLHPTFIGPGSWAADKFMQECSFLASLHHPHIVQFLGIHTDPNSGQIALLLELMNQNLSSLLRQQSSSPLPFPLLVDISHDVSLAILYLHGNGIIHRDLSSNNVLLTNHGRNGRPRAKISDFGMSKLSLQSSPRTSLTQVPGCPVYMPPEAWLTPPIYTEKLDVFSMGVLMVQMITCREPNPGVLELLVEDSRSPTGFMKLPVSEVDRRREDLECVPSDHPLKGLIFECLNDKSKERPNSVDLCTRIDSMKGNPLYYNYEEKKGGKEGEEEREEGEKKNLVQDSNDILLVELREKLISSESELKVTQDKVVQVESEIETLRQELAERDKIIDELKAKQDTTSLQKEDPYKSDKKDDHTSQNNFVLSSLSPEILHVISTDRQSRIFNLAYKNEQGRVMFYKSHSESIDQSARIFLQVYQHFFNSSDVKVSFVSIPTYFPTRFIKKLTELLSTRKDPSYYGYLETPNVIKVISKNPFIHKTNVELLTNILDLKFDLSNGRSLTLIKGDIVKQDVSVIVSSANCRLQHNWGVSAALNVASHFEVQRHCDKYMLKHGIVEVGQVCHTKAGGDLKCSWIVHAVGPPGVIVKEESISTSSGVYDEVIHDMKQLVRKILQQVNKLEGVSVAIPAISSGSLALIACLSAKGIFEGITSYSFPSSSRLVDVRVVVLKEETFVEFVGEFITLFDPKKSHLLNKSSSSSKHFTRSLIGENITQSSDSTDPSLQHSSCKQQ